MCNEKAGCKQLCSGYTLILVKKNKGSVVMSKEYMNHWL